MKFFKTVLTMCLSLAVVETQAQPLTEVLPVVPPALVTNGCGSGRLIYLVPNKTWISQCNFESACNKHDNCYSRCLGGGQMEGLATCDVKADKQRRRAVCDVALQQNIIDDHPGKPLCGMYASMYRFVVQVLGESFFNGVGGAGSVESSLSKFLQYVEKNPGEFDLAEVQSGFEALLSDGLDDANFVVVFEPGDLRLTVEHKGRAVLEIQGQSKNRRLL